METERCKGRCVNRSLFTGKPLISCPPQCWENFRGPTVYLNWCGEAADYVPPVVPKLRSSYCHCNQDSEHDCKYCGKCTYCCEGNECARTTRYDANDFTSRAAFYRWVMDCSCGCIPGNCPSCFACSACCECQLDRPTLDALEAEWREELSAAAAERQSAEGESGPQPAEKSKAKGRRDRMITDKQKAQKVTDKQKAQKKVTDRQAALVRQRRDTAIARIARAESEQKVL